MIFSNISDSNKENAENIYINVKSEFDIVGKESINNVNNKFMLRGKFAYSISHDPIDNIKTTDSKNVSLSGSLINGVNIESKMKGYLVIFLLLLTVMLIMDILLLHLLKIFLKVC
ncbi:hypothetical protein PROPEN_00226 [Proteus penneri ATCC 35198]|nr:hypothetical protein PROPEN_00226 [Proteus penneri ATCC 35198]